MKLRWCIAAIPLVMASNVPSPALADVPDAPTYAASQCGGDGWAEKGYPSYEHCYSFALYYYYLITSDGNGGGGGGGDTAGGSGGYGGGTWIGAIPGYDGSGGPGCASRLCDSGG